MSKILISALGTVLLALVLAASASVATASSGYIDSIGKEWA